MNPIDDGRPGPYFHAETGAVRFWVRGATDGLVGASIRKEVLHYRFGAAIDGADALDTYLAHRSEIDATLERRIALARIFHQLNFGKLVAEPVVIDI